ncbi:MAG: tetratricopeptide repeat protein, partial [Catalinimonas sp.]
AHYYHVDRDSSLLYQDRMRDYAESIGDRKGLATADLLTGNSAYDEGDYSTAQTYNERARAYFERTADTAMLARVYQNIGVTADAAGEKDRAVENYLRAVDYYDALRDSVNVAYLYLNIGLVFKSLENWQKAKRYYADARALLTRLGDAFGLATVDNNTGSLLVEMGRYDSAYHYADRSRRGYAALGYDLYESYSLGVMADASQHLGRGEEAETLYRRCVEVYAANEMHEDLFTVYVGLCNVYARLNRPAQRADVADRALAEARLTGSFEDLRDATRLLYELHKERGDAGRALAYHEEYLTWSDSVSNLAKSELINDLETRYRTAQQEQRLTEQDLKLETQRATIARKQGQLVGLGGGLLLLLVGGVAFYQYQRQVAHARLQASVIAEQQRGYAATIQAAEEERKRVSRELHDGIGQQLSAVKLGLQHLQQQTADGRLGAQLRELTASFTRSADEVRGISHQMMPRALTNEGLRPAVEGLLRQTFRYAATQYAFEHRGLDERLPEAVEVTYYRVLQELVNNVVKHADATHVDVQLYRTRNRLVMRVEDNGRGLTTDTPAEGHGLLNVRQRLALVGGRVHWSSEPGAGTLATVTTDLS